MNFYRHHWFYIGGILFAILSFGMGFFGQSFTHIQVILIYSFMAMLAHQVEEYIYPGGFPSIANGVMFKEKGDAINRYPLNANQCMISNVFLTYPFYIISIFFPGAIWLGLGVIGLGLFQIIAHCFLENILLKKFYNPGCATSIFLFLPLGIHYISYTMANNLLTTYDCIIGVFVTLGAVVFLFGLPIFLLKDRNTAYIFSDIEVKGLRKVTSELYQ